MEKIEAVIEEFIGNYPVCDYLLLPVSELDLSPEVKALCDQDAAVYGERRDVPPAPAQYEKCEAAITGFEQAFLFDAVYEVSDAYDLMACVDQRKEHAALVCAIRDELAARFGETMALSISCDLCDDCPCPKRPCKRPQEAIASMDSYGIRIMKTLADHDIAYDYGIGAAIYFSLILFDPKEAPDEV